jgi:hypothetical protein
LIRKAFDSGSKANLSAQGLSVNPVPKQAIDDAYLRLSHRLFPPPLSVGIKLDGHQMTHILHQSQTSQLYRVINEQGQLFCMKTQSMNDLDDGDYIELFMLESGIGARMNHAHMVSLVE